MGGINLTWEISSNLNDPHVKKILKKFGCKEETPRNKYIIWIYKGSNISIIRYKKKLVTQGKETEENLRLIDRLKKLDGLSLDKENTEKFVKLFKPLHNALLCSKCNSPSLLIEGKIEGLDIVFKKECGHKNNLCAPLLTFTSRILPDINVLIAGHLSKCIELGYFERFEVVIPHFIMNIIDILGKKQKEGASKEIQKLREFEKEEKIKIFHYEDKFEVPSTKEELEREEDDTILKIANITNSILFTCDNNLKDKALLENRPVIYIHQKEAKNIKTIEKVRTS